MTQEDFNLFTASFSIIRANKGMRIQHEQAVNNYENLLKQFKGSEKNTAVKLKMKEVESKIKDIKKEIEKIDKALPKFEKVYNSLEKKYFN